METGNVFQMGQDLEMRFWCEHEKLKLGFTILRLWLRVIEGLMRVQQGYKAALEAPFITVKIKTKSATSLRFCKLSRFNISRRRL